MKKLLICIHNFFVVVNLQYIIKQLSKNYSITLVITSQNLDLSKEQLSDYKKRLNLNDLIVLPIYKHNKKNIIELTISFLKIKKLLYKNDFKACLVDNNLDVWLKVITNNFKKSGKKIIGIKHDSLALNTSKVEEFLLNGNVDNILATTHKLREVTLKIENSNRIIKSNLNIFKNLLKKIKKLFFLFFERYFLPFLFFGNTFGYSKLDLSTGFDNKTINQVICLFYTGYIFWGSVYGFDKTFYVSYKNNCKCSSDKTKSKTKILFLASLLWEKELNLLNNQITKLKEFISKIIDENKNINQIDIKLHPEETLENVIKIKKIISEKKIPLKINYLENISLIEESCNYKLAFGMVSSSLYYASSSCDQIDVYCLKSLSSHNFDKYYLKLFNENIIFYDDINNKIENQNLIFENMVFDKSINKTDINLAIKKILD
jgi:hypothetical protein